ncbi:MAG: hypothetical protein IV090_10075 [Candidatus Sericytochromatia bacterium]|nr:hypothetical protein [Candidatus Sericytochromatia bacterium]
MNTVTLNQDSRKKVKREMKHVQIKGDMRYYNRLQAFLLLDLRLSLAEVADYRRHTLRTLYSWLQLFITKGLNSKSPKGRKAKLSKRQKQELKRKIVAGPEANGYPIRTLDGGHDSKPYSPALGKRICHQIHS